MSYYAESSIIETPNACIVDLIPPTFSGISTAVAQNNGSTKITWNAATDATTPIRYNIYIAYGSVSATSLFQPNNLVMVSPPNSTSSYIFNLAPGVWLNPSDPIFLTKGQIYTYGVRAIDGVGNIDNNNTILTEITSNYVDTIPEYICKFTFSIATDNTLKGFFNLQYEGSDVTTGLVSGKYTIYDDTNTPVAGMTESGIIADSDGIFVITPIDASLLQSFTHYRVKLEITHSIQTYVTSWGMTIGE